MNPDASHQTVLGKARGGDGEAFRQLIDPYRRELQMHCYRILGSIQDAEDVLQETLVAAWRALDRFDGRSLRPWLYRIATNRCLNELRGSSRRSGNSGGRSLVPSIETSEPWWLEPYPDALIDDTNPGPEARYDARESIALSFVASLQNLPAQQRAVLILRDAVGFSAAETAHILGTTVPAVNSALHRARSDFPATDDPELVPLPRSAREAAIVRQFVEAFEQGDIRLLVALLTDDALLTMPPESDEYRGPQAIGEFFQSLSFWVRPHQLVPTRANGQPAFGFYLEDPNSGLYRAVGILVVGLRQDQICRMTRFGDKALIGLFGLPRTLPKASSPPRSPSDAT
jgi:RNA polymerase sigma-70 factor (ECF subfamily)